MTTPAPPAKRWHDLDALRGFAMLLGILLHAALAFFPSFWPVQDRTAGSDGPYDEILHAIHGFRMPLFFLLSGFFTAMLWRRRGLRRLIDHRFRRIVIPLAIGLVTIVPLMNWVAERTSADRFDNLLAAVYYQNETAVGRLLDDGADPELPKGESGDSPLHLAALLDNADIARMLLEAGSSPVVLDDQQDSPLGYAYYAGSAAVADVLVEYGHPEIRPPGTDWEDLEAWGFGAADLEEILGLDTWITSLHHLWFLWFLVLLVAGFAVAAALIDRFETRGRPATPGTGAWAGRLMWLLVPLALLPQLAMGGGGEVRVFGPDTSAGIVPVPHVLLYYAVFFAFGALLWGRPGRDGDPLVESLGRGWQVVLPAALVVVFPAALWFTFDASEPSWLVASLFQLVFTWAMIAGLMGLFRALLSRERRGVRYLSDSSYWLYLAHLPLVIAAQYWIRDWDLPSGIKLLGLTAVVTVFLLATYQLFIRYTPIGTMLNGKRVRPERAVRQEA